MELSIDKIIQQPVISDKAYKLNRKGQVMFYVHMQANSPLIKKAFEKLFNVKVSRVNTEIRQGKSRRVKRIKVNGTDTKLAYITLAPGYTLDLFGQVVNENTAAQVSTT